MEVVRGPHPSPPCRGGEGWGGVAPAASIPPGHISQVRTGLYSPPPHQYGDVMGLEAVCTARFQGRAAEGKALLETDALFFRGELRLKIPLKSVIAVTVDSGDLSVTFPDGTVVFEIGDTADKWAHAMLHPKGRADKLGVKAGMRIALVSLDDTDFRDELISRD